MPFMKEYNKGQASKLLHVSRMTLDKMIRDGVIKTEVYGGFTVIPESEIQRFDIDPDKHNHKVKLKQ